MGETVFEEVLSGLGWETNRIGNVCLFIEKQGLFLWVYVDEVKMAGRELNVALMWKNSMKLVDLREPTLFLDHVYLGYSQREMLNTNFCWSNCKIAWVGETSRKKMSHGPTTKNVMLQSVLKDIVSWRTKRQNTCTKFSTPCLNDHHFKEELDAVGELSDVFSRNFLKCLYLARIGRPDILWSVNKIA